MIAEGEAIKPPLNMTDKLQKLTECSICYQTFTDPRILPCIHTFCLNCLKRTEDAAQKKSAENMPCPLCRKAFVIPTEGMSGLQKNFFMESLIDVTNALEQGQEQISFCEMCTALHEGDEEKVKEATMRCAECEENFCDTCSKAHKQLKLSKTHNVVKIGCKTEEVTRKKQPIRNCSIHNQQPLSLYCDDCKEVVCLSCFAVKHASHKCRDVTTVHEEFRQAIERDARKIAKYVEEIKSKGEMVEQRKTEFLLSLTGIENKIQQRTSELKEMIDIQTASLLKQLSEIKHRQLKPFEKAKAEIDHIHTVFENFETYCHQLIRKGSDSDVCSYMEELIKRANELEKDHKEFISRPVHMTEISFENADLRVGGLPCNKLTNIMGRIECPGLPFVLSDSELKSSELILSASSSQDQSTSPLHEQGDL